MAAMKVRAAVNNVVMRTLKVIYPGVLDIGCFSHTVDMGSNSRHLFSQSFLHRESYFFLTVLRRSYYGKSKQGEQHLLLCNKVVEPMGGLAAVVTPVW